MVWVKLDYSDGRWTARAVSESENVRGVVIAVEDSIWEAYQAHLKQDAVFQLLWNNLYRLNGK